MHEIKMDINELAAMSAQFSKTVIAYSPRLIGALVFLAAGWFLARLAGFATRRLLRSLNAFLDQRWRSRMGARIRLSPTVIGLSGTIAHWTLLFLVLVGTSHILELTALSDWLGRAVNHLPVILAAAIMVFVGVVISQFAREIVVTGLQPAAGRHAAIFGRLTQVAVVALALVVGLDQTGLDTSLFVSIVTILLAALAGGMALAFGLGARDMVANVIGVHHARRTFAVGETARLGDLRGEVVRLLPTSVVLLTEEGRVTVPGALFQREAVTILGETEADDD